MYCEHEDIMYVCQCFSLNYCKEIFIHNFEALYKDAIIFPPKPDIRIHDNHSSGKCSHWVLR